jgi:maltose alpha-D-glucosyltransferase/alpha-amylase
MIPEDVAASVRDLLPRADAAIHGRFDPRGGRLPDGSVSRIRIHGDYHLGQILWAEGDFYILDFEGEPARPLVERRRKESPMKDVAGMLRSFSYAAYAALFAHSGGRAEEVARLEPWARSWERRTGAAFLQSYLDTAGPAGFVPPDPGQRQALLELFLVDKALYELNYELNNRPDWARIPLRGLAELLA